jgi:hypothetical protein
MIFTIYPRQDEIRCPLADLQLSHGIHDHIQIPILLSQTTEAATTGNLAARAETSRSCLEPRKRLSGLIDFVTHISMTAWNATSMPDGCYAPKDSSCDR